MTVTEEQRRAVEVALQPLDEGFAADGAGLSVSGGGDCIEVRLVLTDESCADCIVAPPLLREIVTGRLADVGVSEPVRLIDPRE